MAKALHTHHFMLIEGNGDIYCPFVKELGMIRAEYMTLIIKFKKIDITYTCNLLIPLINKNLTLRFTVTP